MWLDITLKFSSKFKRQINFKGTGTEQLLFSTGQSDGKTKTRFQAWLLDCWRHLAMINTSYICILLEWIGIQIQTSDFRLKYSSGGPGYFKVIITIIIQLF